MTALIWSGAAVSLIGLCGIVYCIWRVMAAKRAGLDEAALRAALQSAVALNLGALFVSMIGLMMVVVGVVLG